ncbi:class I SAM-dependent methyltransferase [Streptomyces sp. NPDC005438]|uniref:class I SAM-dependent methyltransferase n=1 Tax=Streptomyces sp. NPDC005438 TaxID=3156880 RepID=UPI0033B13913
MDGSELSGVSRTTLWTLHNRATEAARPRPLLEDPQAVRLLREIDYPYEETFGKPSQSHALRALCFDRVVRRFRREWPQGTVVALGEGLQTGYWRLGDRRAPWVTVDLPEVVALRRRLLPEEGNLRQLALSALDRSWQDEVEPGQGVLLSAEGLLMYFEPEQVYALLRDCARRFPGGWMIFDSIPHWFSRRTLRGLRLTPGYTAPPMPFALSVPEAARLPERVPGLASATDLPLPPGRGPWRYAATLGGLPLLRGVRPSITLVRFAHRS